ncbi:hypothetical protein Tco_0616062 [Tanacetum coccineum]
MRMNDEEARHMLSGEKFTPCLDGIVSKLGYLGAQGMSYREQLNTHVKESMSLKQAQRRSKLLLIFLESESTVQIFKAVLLGLAPSNKLQSLNASFPLGVVAPTTLTEAGSSVALGCN